MSVPLMSVPQNTDTNYSPTIQDTIMDLEDDLQGLISGQYEPCPWMTRDEAVQAIQEQVVQLRALCIGDQP